MTKKPLTREQWLNEMGGLMLTEIIEPVYTIRTNFEIRISVGYPAGTKPGGKHIACCHPSRASEGGRNEIFITPALSGPDSVLILTCLLHEIIHAIDDCEHGHRGLFSEIAHSVGFIGRMAEPTANDDLIETFEEYIDILGEMPHSALDYTVMKTQVNRNLKVWCEDKEGCGFKFNTSKTQIERCVEARGEIMCPKCGNAMAHNA